MMCFFDHGTVGSRWKVQDLPWPQAQMMKNQVNGEVAIILEKKLNRTPKTWAESENGHKLRR